MSTLNQLKSKLDLLITAIKEFIVQNDPYENDYDTPHPCVLGKKYFTHLRRYVEDPLYLGVELSNYGGATLCWVIEKAHKEGTYYLFYTWSECSLKPDPETGRPDQFCKKTGRLICLENFTKHDKLHVEVRNNLLTVAGAREYVIEQFKICKQPFYKDVWTEYQ